MGDVTILEGDCRATLQTLPDESVDCVVTSPPYYEQRDYEHDHQIGLEKSPQEYVAELVNVFSEVRRVLKADGAVWLNLGDSYYSGNGQPTKSDNRSPARNFSRTHKRFLDTPGMGLPKKSLLGIPWRVAHALQDDGWTIRAEVIWYRKSAFVEANVRDRPSRSHETIFMLSKSRRYHFNRDHVSDGTVWEFEHQRGLRGHNAAYPIDLAKRCIEASCREGGVVLDPFGGAGSTALAATVTGRPSILCELNPDYIAVARQRLSNADNDNDLFAASA